MSEEAQAKLDQLIEQIENLGNGTQQNGQTGNEIVRDRHARSEKEKDADLLREVTEVNPTTNIVRFENSPWYVTGGQMRDYQVRGLNWLMQLYHASTNGILADEMGLGKTLQTVSMLGYLRHFVNKDKNNGGFYLVIAPKSTLQNWVNEVHRWVPSLRAVALIGNEEERRALAKKVLFPGNWDVLVTSYEMVLKEKSLLKKFKYQYLAIDEAHRIKNEKSKLSETVRQFKSDARLLITGTPLQNNLHELWALLNFLMPSMFDSAENFDQLFNLDSMGQQDLVVKLHQVLKPFLLRRLKLEVEKQLPPKKEVKVYIGLTPVQRDLYTKILMKDIDGINANVRQADKNRLQNILMQLRKCTNHPYLFDGVEPGPPYSTDYHLVESCGKMVLLDKLLARLHEQGSRVLLFSQMTSMLDILEDYVRWRQYKYCRLDGQTAHVDRQNSIDDFNSEKSDKFIFMLSTRAGGLGINLTSADVVIIYDSDWNPQVDLQAQDRAHRIGQKKTVRVFRLITEHTVEERIIARADMKLRLDSVVIQAGRLADAKQNALGKEDMLAMIKHGANYIFRSDASGVVDADIDELLAKGEERTEAMAKALDGMGETGLAKFTLDTSTEGADYSLYNFEGEDYRQAQQQQMGIVGGFIEPPSRRKRSAATANLALVTNTYETDQDEDKDYKVANAKVAKRESSCVTNGGGDWQMYPKRWHELAGLQRELSADEAEEQERLAVTAFPDWNRRDLATVVRGLDAGQDVPEVAGKSTKQVQAYLAAAALWAPETPETETDFYVKLRKAAEKGKKRIDTAKRQKAALDAKMLSVARPESQIRIQYGGNKGRLYSEEEDRFLVVNMWRLGGPTRDPNVWERLRTAIRSEPDFRMSWFLLQRKADDLKKRCSSLINFIVREFDKLEREQQQQLVLSAGNKVQSSDDNTEYMRG